MKKEILTLVVCAFLLIGIVGCGNNSSAEAGGSSQELYETMSIKDINSATDSNSEFYKNYINKKIKITDLKVNDSMNMTTDSLVTVTVSCSNKSSLDITTGETVSVTGVLDSSSSTYLYFLSNCTVEK